MWLDLGSNMLSNGGLLHVMNARNRVADAQVKYGIMTRSGSIEIRLFEALELDRGIPWRSVGSTAKELGVRCLKALSSMVKGFERISNIPASNHSSSGEVHL